MKKRKSNILTKIILIALVLGTLVFVIDSFITKNIYPLEYKEYIDKYAVEYGIPPEVIAAVIDVESNFKYDAVSYKQARGLMQITPETFTWLCTKLSGDDDVELLFDPETNIKYGSFFLKYLYDEFGVWETVHAAYNAGRGRINNWLKDENISYGKDLIDIPIKETREYVEKVMKARIVYKETYYKKK